MPDEQLTSDEWLELYRYLLARLQERGFAVIRAEIEVAAAAPVFEESTPEEDLRISQIIRREVGRASMRLRTPAEMFGTALEIFRARLTELPVVADAASRHLDRSAERVEFRLDAPTQSEPVPLTRLSVSSTEVIAISEALMRLGLRPDRIKAD